jgi:cyclin-dependent kinase 12/13
MNRPLAKEDGEFEKDDNKYTDKNQSVQYEYMKRIPASQWASRSSDLYERVYQVGEGTFGKVYKAKVKSLPVGGKSLTLDQHVALKKILMDNEKEGFPITAIREIMILKRLNHENIIKLIEIVTSKPSEKNKQRGNVYLVFEYMEHDLTGLIDNKISFTVSQIKCILHQLLTGVQYMHSNNIIHRDIKGANILINNKGQVKIADFGLARIHNPNPNINKQYTNRVVTLWYRSPELLLGSTDYGPSVDIWSVGCLFSELLTGVAPFKGSKENEQIEKIFEKCGTPTEETWPKVTSMRYYNQLAPKHFYPYTLKSYYSDNKK